MNFDLSEEQAMLRDSAERVAREFGGLERRRERIARGEGFDPAFWAQFGELGWLALPLPEDQGGLGGTIEDVALLMIELGRWMSTEPIVSSVILCGGVLTGSAWPERGAWLEQLAGGAARLAFAHAEAGDRIERAAPRATMLAAHGDGFALTGEKQLVLDGDGADGYLVTASTADGLAVVLVRPDAAGLAIAAYPLIDGTRACDLRLDGVAIAAGDVIVRGPEAAALIDEALARAIIASLAAAVGSMEACLDLCGDYLKTRAQFGQPIGKFQALQHIIVDMLVETHNARSSLYGALAHAAGGRAVRERTLAMAKYTVGQAALAVSRAGIQLHGGYGVTDEYAISHHHRFLLAQEKKFGDSRVYAERLAELTL